MRCRVLLRKRSSLLLSDKGGPFASALGGNVRNPSGCSHILSRRVRMSMSLECPTWDRQWAQRKKHVPVAQRVRFRFCDRTRACVWKLSTRRHGSDVRQVLRRWILVAERRGRNIVDDARCSAANVNGVQSSCVSSTVSCSGGIDAASDRRMTARRWLWNTSGHGARGVRPAVRFDVLAGTHE